MKKCLTNFCRNRVAKGNFCFKCAKAKWRLAHPMQAAFDNLRTNAKRRGKDFSLTMAEFEAFCYATEYIQGKGKSKTSLTIDRIDNEKGYHLDNIRVLTNSENSFKHTKMLSYDWQCPDNTRVLSLSIEILDTPF